MISKDQILAAFRKDLIITVHTYERLKDRELTVYDLEKAILSDEILENYPDDYPLPSVLLLGFLDNQNPLHIVCAATDLGLTVITAYIPNVDLWEENWKERKEISGDDSE